MVIFDPDKVELVEGIYAAERTRRPFNITNVVVLSSLFNTTKIDSGVVSQNSTYWELLHLILNNIQTGRWNAHPDSFAQYVKINTVDKLQSDEISLELRNYMRHREDVCNKLGIQSVDSYDKYLKLKWLRNPNGTRDMISTAKALADIYTALSFNPA